ncbi:MAG: hypothetical protein J5I94_07975 [Phaeodactylibacter sp.]|nr:hypothetical protein [Phaeodactylibacter sp.]
MEAKDRANRQFYFGVIAHGRFKDLALEVLPALEDRLNEQVDLRRYTDKFDKVFFIPILDLGEEPIEERKYDEETRKLSLRKTIPVDEIEAEISEHDFSVLISVTLLELMEGAGVAPDGLIKELRKVLNG